MMRLLFLLVLLILPAEAPAEEELIAGLSRNRISISANFDGSEILIFGAVKRDAPAAEDPPGFIVTIEGPKTPLTLRRKDRMGPIWVNVDTVEIDRAPSFYAVNTSAPLRDVLTHTSDMRHSITVEQAIRFVGASGLVEDPARFTEALIRIRERSTLYQTNISAVTVREGTLFNTSVVLPANLVEGVYTSRLFLTRNGMVVAEASAAINVEKVGLERFLYVLAHEDALIYGLLSLAIAVVAGWGASAVFRYLQG